MMKVWKLVFIGLMLSFFCQSVFAANLTLVAYNVESGSAEAPTVARTIKKIKGNVINIKSLEKNSKFGIYSGVLAEV